MEGDGVQEPIFLKLDQAELHVKQATLGVELLQIGRIARLKAIAGMEQGFLERSTLKN